MMKSITTLSLLFLCSSMWAQVISIADMNSPRQVHQATALINGDVLVTGGEGDGDFWNTAERWDASNDQWSFVDDMAEIRWSHTATLLDNGMVLVTGGWDGQNVNHQDTELFNADLDVWEEGPNMSIGRSNHRAIKLTDGKVLICGGYNGVEDQSSCDIYDPMENSLSPTGDLNFGRSSFTLTLLEDGRVMAVGGFNPNLDFQMDEAEIYDPQTGDWSLVAPLEDGGTDNHAAILLSNGDVMISGGRYYDAVEDWFGAHANSRIYSVANDNWSAIDMDDGHSYHSMYDFAGMILLPGGANITGSGVTTVLANTVEYNQESMTWVDPLIFEAEGRHRYASCQLPNGNVVVCGGEDDVSGEMYVLPTNIDELQPPLLSLYPNPAHTRVFVKTPYLTWNGAIYDSQGRIVQLITSSESRLLDIGDLPQGIYSVILDSGDVRLNSKLVKNQ